VNRRLAAIALAPMLALSLRAQEGEPTAAPTPAGTPTPPPVTLCVSCHENLAGALSEPVHEWTGSVHWAAGISCNGCHGGDPQSEELAHSRLNGFVGRPTARDVPYFCGQCHAAFMEKHLAGPHGRNVLPTCTYCHGSHDIQPPTPDIISPERCTRCHSYEMPRRFREVIVKAEDLLSQAQAGMARLEQMKYNSHFLQQRLGEAHGDRVQIHLAVHSFDIAEVTDLVTKLEEVTQLITDNVTFLDEAAGLRAFNHRLHIVGFIALVLFALLLELYRHRHYHHHRWLEQLPPDWEIPKKK
jgi:hypothetical protein